MKDYLKRANNTLNPDLTTPAQKPGKNHSWKPYRNPYSNPIITNLKHYINPGWNPALNPKPVNPKTPQLEPLNPKPLNPKDPKLQLLNP